MDSSTPNGDYTRRGGLFSKSDIYKREMTMVGNNGPLGENGR